LPIELEGFKGDIKAKFVAILKAVSKGFFRAVDWH